MIDLRRIIENGKVGESYKLIGLPKEMLTVEVTKDGLKITGSKPLRLCDDLYWNIEEKPFITPEKLTFSDAIRAVLFEGKTIRGDSWIDSFALSPCGDSFGFTCDGDLCSILNWYATDLDSKYEVVD